MHQPTRNSLLLVISNIFGAVLGFAQSLVIARGLGEADFGLWTFCFAWAAILTMLCEYGLNTLLTREAARNPNDSNRLMISSLIAKLGLVIVIGGIIWVASPILGLDAHTSAAIRVIVLIVAAGLAFGSFTAMFRAFGWMSPILWLNLIGLLMQLVWSVSAIESGHEVLWLIWIAAIIDILQVITALGLWCIALQPRGGPITVSWVGVISILRQATPFAISGALDAVQMRSSVLFLGYLRGAVEVGWFGAASRFSETAKLIPYGIFGALYPAFATELGAAHFRKFNRILQVISLSLTLLLCFLARPIMTLSFGPDFLPGVPILFWLGLGLLPSLMNGTIELFLYATGDENYATRLRAIGVIVQLSSGLLLINFFGATGVAISLMLGEIAIWFPLRRRLKIILERDSLAKL